MKTREMALGNRISTMIFSHQWEIMIVDGCFSNATFFSFLFEILHHFMFSDSQ